MLRLYSLPRRRRAERILSAASGTELLDILHEIRPGRNRRQLYAEMKVVLEKKRDVLFPEELAQMKAAMLFLNE